MRWLAVAVCVAVSGSAWADENLDLSAEVDVCFSKGLKTGHLSCIGEASNHCQGTVEGGASTLGIVECNALEAGAWDAILNREYAAVLGYAKKLDADDPSPAGNVVEIVKKAERAWIAFRDAQCLMAYAGWGGGSMRSIASSGCTLRMTAERALALRGWYQVEPEEQP